MTDILNAISRDLDAYYTETLHRPGVAEQVGWKNEQAQRVRFEVLLDVITGSEAFSLNDLGCGLGTLADVLEARWGGGHDYRGYDIRADMIEGARRLHAGKPGRRFIPISNAGEMEPADYTVASGIFNLRADLSDTAWMAYILETLGHMNAASRKGFSFNILTKYSDADRMRPELYYADPCFFFDYCKRTFSRDVALRHDYREYDFTMIVRK